MSIQYPLTKANRIRLASAFRDVPRVDLAIDCVLEAQMGKAFVDDLDHPTAFHIQIEPFNYFAGQARSPGGMEMLNALSPSALLMSAPPKWIEVAQELHGAKLTGFTRYSFSSENLSLAHLEDLIQGSRFKDAGQRIDAASVAQVIEDSLFFMDISPFDSAEDFVERGIGFCLMEHGAAIGLAYSSLVCNKGIEVSIFVQQRHRGRGIATYLGSLLLKWCLEHRLDAHWDAANQISCRLAEKLGYTPTSTYTAYFLQT